MRNVPYICFANNGCTTCIVLSALVLCIFSKTGSTCKPIISKGSHSHPVVDGYSSLECEISSCLNVSRIIYEKEDINEWTQVFEGFSKTDYRSLRSIDDGYSLEGRNDYTVFYSQHILYIQPLVLGDKGKWRCAVYNINNRLAESQFLELVITEQCTPIISIGSHNKQILGGHSSIECEISTCSNVTRIIYEKTEVHDPTQWTPIFEGFNKTIYKVLNTKSHYSLATRTEYTAFYSRHILYIKPLILEDQGEWRCVVYDSHNKQCGSHALDFYMAVHCTPDISEGSHSKLELGGYTSLECEISDCQIVKKISFEKKGIHNHYEWTQIFEGRNKNDYLALDTGIEYSLSNRAEYTAFYSQHILYIKPLIYEDQGEWRCVVHDLSNRRSESQPMNLYLGKACKPEISEGSHHKLAVDGHTSLECEYHTCVNVSRVIYEKSVIDQTETWTPVFEGKNKTSYRALDTGTQYSLANRSEYAAFFKEHILYIRPLKTKDQGEWRCIVYDQANETAVSPVYKLTLQFSEEYLPGTVYQPTSPAPITQHPDPVKIHETYPSNSDPNNYIVYVIFGSISLLYIVYCIGRKLKRRFLCYLTG